KVGDKAEEPLHSLVLLHSGHCLHMPLPLLLADKGGAYPEIRLKTIKDTIEKQMKLGRVPAQLRRPSPVKGEDDVFQAVAPNAATQLIAVTSTGKDTDRWPAGAANETKFEDLPDY